ncbi:MAG: glycosyltransferase family 9 protein [Acidobacteria bacterium]|nr:glycosyltransferase family 9 protein [Acidobacteriota bacterium]
MRILLVRLGAMGDVIHALPAAATLRRSFPGARITWVVEPRWSPLLERNPAVDEVVLFDRQGGARGMWRSARALAPRKFTLALDLQGLLKSAMAARLAAPGAQRWGRDRPREWPAGWLYNHRVPLDDREHIVDQHLALVTAAGGTMTDLTFPLPAGRPEGTVPAGPFVLASPLAGWGAKQWPLDYYTQLAAQLDRRLGLPLVVNLPPNDRTEVPGAILHRSTLNGLIDTTRRAAAVLGVDSGPLHLAAALGKPGVALFGPTDPARNGPYGGTLTVLRRPNAATSYARTPLPDASMRALAPDTVLEALIDRIPSS